MARTAFRPNRAVMAALVAACLLALLACARVTLAQGVAHDGSATAAATVTTPTDGAAYSVALEQCATATAQAERSATFTAQMTATSATQRMGIRIELQQRPRGETAFHTVIAPGLGVWRSSEPGVKIYKYVKQVTNLAAPAAYRAVVRFRWLGTKGRVLKRAELRTPRCLQPTLPAQVKQTPGA